MSSVRSVTDENRSVGAEPCCGGCVCSRLERCNDVLERQVAVLRVCLERHKRSQSVAEIKIRNMQRAKADADRRNSSLQREMETFFQTYGDARKRGGDEDGKGGGSI